MSNFYRAPVDPSRPKYYVLEMFPYPSGKLHMGHMRVYSIGDVLARFLRMRGYNVIHPMGWDAFGLPTENAAIDNRVSPEKWTERNVTQMKRQQQRLGISYDRDREVNTSSPDYYRWTQWLFLLMHRRGLAYKKRAAVNWCPRCPTVLANEQVGSRTPCWRCESEVEQQEREQWFLRITDYADRLLNDLALLEDWPERVKVMQQNWIGRSEGARRYLSGCRNFPKKRSASLPLAQTLFRSDLHGPGAGASPAAEAGKGNKAGKKRSWNLPPGLEGKVKLKEPRRMRRRSDFYRQTCRQSS